MAMKNEKNEKSLVKVDEGMLDRWINTPFSYMNVLSGKTKVEQDILLQVSGQIQCRIKDFFNEVRNLKSNISNRVLIAPSDPILKIPIRIKFSDYEISSNYGRIRLAVENIKNIQLRIAIPTTEGVREAWVHVFSHGVTDMPGSSDCFGRGWADLYLNPALIERIFNMSNGYVQHPRFIARNSKTSYTTMLYALLKNRCEKSGFCRIPLLELKEYLGLLGRELTTGMVVSDPYHQYSRFRMFVLDRAKKDLDKMSERGQIDYTFSYTENRGGPRSEPDSINFTLIPTEAGVKRIESKGKKAVRTRLINTLVKRCGDLNRDELAEIVSRVGEGDMPDFKEFVYKRLPSILERFYPEDAASFIKKQLNDWISERKSTQPLQQRLFEPGTAKDDDYDKVSPGQFSAEYAELLKRCPPEYREWLDKAKFIGGQRGGIFIEFPDRPAMEAFEKFELDPKNAKIREEFSVLYSEVMGRKMYNSIIRGFALKK